LIEAVTRRWWPPVALAIGAVVSMSSYFTLGYVARLPPDLRDRPWPFEAACAGFALASLLVAGASRRVGAALASLLALGTVALFGSYVHVLSYRLPPPPPELAVGQPAPPFELPDENGRPLALASLRGRPALLVFYRGFW
jgi:hypothetical protein